MIIFLVVLAWATLTLDGWYRYFDYPCERARPPRREVGWVLARYLAQTAEMPVVEAPPAAVVPSPWPSPEMYERPWQDRLAEGFRATERRRRAAELERLWSEVAAA